MPKYGYDQRRGNRHRRGYNSRWVKARDAYLKTHKTCVKCGAPSQEVDHIEPHQGDRRKFWRRSNWQALCKPCHSRKTRREMTGIDEVPIITAWFERWGDNGEAH